MLLCALVPAAYFLVRLKCSSNGLRQTEIIQEGQEECIRRSTHSAAYTIFAARNFAFYISEAGSLNLLTIIQNFQTRKLASAKERLKKSFYELSFGMAVLES